MVGFGIDNLSYRGPFISVGTCGLGLGPGPGEESSGLAASRGAEAWSPRRGIRSPAVPRSSAEHSSRYSCAAPPSPPPRMSPNPRLTSRNLVDGNNCPYFPPSNSEWGADVRERGGWKEGRKDGSGRSIRSELRSDFSGSTREKCRTTLPPSHPFFLLLVPTGSGGSSASCQSFGFTASVCNLAG